MTQFTGAGPRSGEARDLPRLPVGLRPTKRRSTLPSPRLFQKEWSRVLRPACWGGLLTVVLGSSPGP